MKLRHTLYTTEVKATWVRELKDLLARFGNPDVEIATEEKDLEVIPSQLVFIDGHLPNLDALLARMDRRGKAVFLVMKEELDPAEEIPAAVLNGIVQDVLMYPFRPIEVLGKLRSYQQILAWEEVATLNQNFSGILDRLRADLALAERMQTARRKTRFPDIQGMKVHSRYFAGMKSGGEFFDLAESKSKFGPIAWVLSDSSSYGLSSIVLGVLVRVIMKLASDQPMGCIDAVKRVWDEVLVTLGEKDELSLFYGILSRKDLKLRYVNFGHSRVFHAADADEFAMLPGKSAPLSREHGPDTVIEREISLSPKDRIVLLSDGFLETCGGEKGALKVLNAHRALPQAKLLNELAYGVKGKLADDDMPAQDCTAVVADLDSKLLKLA
jgi:hypothetical protein